MPLLVYSFTFVNKNLLIAEFLHEKPIETWRNVTVCSSAAGSSGVPRVMQCSFLPHFSHRHPAVTVCTCAKETPVLQCRAGLILYHFIGGQILSVSPLNDTRATQICAISSVTLTECH